MFLYRIKDLFQEFISDNLDSVELGNSGFSFADNAIELANDLINSLVIDVAIDLDFVFGLNLNPIFNSSSTSILDRVPDFFIQINHFDITGILGVNDWTSSIDFSGLEFTISEAKALLNVSSTLSSHPMRINSPSELTTLVNSPTSEDRERIIFSASLDVSFPVFLIHEGIGFGIRIEYL